MKKLLTNLTLVTIVTSLVALFSLTSCEKENPEDFLGSINVQLVLKAGLKDIPLSNVNLSLINTQDNVEKKVLTDANGQAVIGSLPAGTYNLNISEPRENGEYTLSGTSNSIVVNMKQETSVQVTVDAVISNAGLVIKEVYFMGANDKYVSLYKDAFIEIFNNSSEVIYADSLYVGQLYPDKWDRTMPKPFAQMLDIENFAFLEWIYMLPGTGKQYPIAPSKSIVIALNAINFKEGNPMAENAMDNTGADFETYCIPWLEAKGKKGNPTFDMNNPDVPNVIPIFLERLNYFGIDIYSPSLIIFRKKDAFTEADIFNFDYVNNKGKDEHDVLMKLPITKVIDGVEIMANSTLGAMKSLPTKVDASFTYLKADGGAAYTGMSLRRKIDKAATAKFGRVVLQDLNSSFADFEAILKPDPKGYNNL